MVKEVPALQHLLFLRNVSIVVLLQILSNNVVASPLHLKIVPSADSFIFIVRADTFIILERSLDVLVEDIH
jgi:hypothetical protein